MKRVLIISPHFVPVNAADMHRVRQSLAFYESNGWKAEIVMVDENFIEGVQDKLLLETIPRHIIIHKVKAWSPQITRKFGLGNIAFRAMYNYYKFVNALLQKEKYDLIFFSTTAFPICALGRLWHNKFQVPYVIDMQDPWRSDHYLELPKSKRPPKFWLSYQIDSFLEKFSMKKVGGLISVSKTYLEVLNNRYSNLKNIPKAVIPFAANEIDILVANKSKINNSFFDKSDGYFHMTYVGRGGSDMEKSGRLILLAFKNGLIKYPDLFAKLKLYFIGTSYATNENANFTFMPIAKDLNVEKNVIESTQRISYFESLNLLNDSNILMVPGSDNIGYTASKIYNYVWLRKPLFTVFETSSSVNNFMKSVNAGLAIMLDQNENENIQLMTEYIYSAINGSHQETKIDWEQFNFYTASYQTEKQTELFNLAIKK